MTLQEGSPAEPVLLRRDGAIAVLQLNRPSAFNALDVPTATAFRAACRQLAAARDVRAVVLSGAGRSFGVGGDLAAMREEGGAVVAPQLIDALHESVQILAALDAPVLASLQGAVAGGSMSLALAADLAIAAENASFNLAYSRIGASCDLSGSWQLPRLVGLRRAMEIAILSDTIDAAEALRLGLVNRVVATERLEEETMDLARRLAEGPTLAYGRLKRLLRRSFERDLAGQLADEREAFVASSGTADFAEGVASFVEKRAPQFPGK
jgi:2-(1,2-epoxy-1,2-dihydrophenyl)acetyl-CoA isomerase